MSEVKTLAATLKWCFPFGVPATVNEKVGLPRQARETLDGWRKGQIPPSGIITGKTGTGKSAIAARMAATEAEIFARSHVLGAPEKIREFFMPVVFIPVGELTRREPLESFDSLTAADLALRARLLVIDDLGWEDEREKPAIARIIATRYNVGDKILVTTGYPVNRLLERYGEAFVRRVLEAGGPEGKIWELE